MSGSLRITWVVPFLSFTGGIRVVYEHSRELVARGHDVTIVAPRSAPVLPTSAAAVRALRAWAVEKFILKSERMIEYYGLAGRLRVVPALEARFLPPADVTLATSFHTAPAVHEAGASAGRKAYFLQHYEAFDTPNAARVDASWKFAMEKIVIASWMVRFAEEKFGERVWGPIVNGVDFAQFHDRGRVPNDPPVVGMLYETMPWKGFDDGFAAVTEARRSAPQMKLRLFGRPRLAHRLGPLDTYERNPSPERLSALYRACDFFLSPSWTEGCQLPPMEAMASGCAVVATDVGGVPDYAVSGETALTAPPRQPHLLAAHLARLAADRTFASALARRGRDHIAAFTWPRASGQLESTLRAIASGATA